MTLTQAKKLAFQRAHHFYWDRELRVWICYPKDFEREATYHTRASLAKMSTDYFTVIYLEK